MRYGAAALLCAAVLTDTQLFNDPAVIRWVALYALFVLTALTIRPRWDRVDAAIVASTAYAGLTLLWSPDPMEGMIRAQNVLALAGVVFLARHGSLPVGAIAGIVIVAIAVLSLLSERTFGWQGNENFRTATVLISLPLALYLPRWWREGVVGVGIATMAFWPTGGVVAALGAMCVTGLIWCLRRRIWFPLFLALAASGNVVFLDIDNPTIWQRIELWHNAGVLFLEAPLFGHGLGAWAYEYPRVSEAHLWLIDRTLLSNIGMQSVAAHNDLLQAFVILGVVGAGLGCLVLWFANWRSWAGLSLVITGGVAFVGFPLQVPASAAMAALALGCALRQSSPGLAWSDRACSGFAPKPQGQPSTGFTRKTSP